MVDVIELHRWPSDDSIAHLVVIDHRRTLRPADIRQSVNGALARSPSAIRTGALFPDVADVFAEEGFHVIDTLVLLTRTLDHGSDEVTRSALRHALRVASRSGLRIRKLGRRRLAAAAAVDRAAFGEELGHRPDSLWRIAEATPRHHQRVVVADRSVVALAITGFGQRRGYLQRLSVEPDCQRRGIGRLLVLDSLAWLHQQGAESVMVNTSADNVAALDLYRTLGFSSVPDRLRVMELTLHD